MGFKFIYQSDLVIHSEIEQLLLENVKSARATLHDNFCRFGDKFNYNILMKNRDEWITIEAVRAYLDYVKSKPAKITNTTNNLNSADAISQEGNII